MWIELIGFDNEKPDFGVAEFLDNAGFVPAGLSLLFATPDFIHTHEGLEREVAFPPDHCSYGGKPYNTERRRQAWTNWQLSPLASDRGARAGGGAGAADVRGELRQLGAPRGARPRPNATPVPVAYTRSRWARVARLPGRTSVADHRLHRAGMALR
jgi:hypothetical protein